MRNSNSSRNKNYNNSINKKVGHITVIAGGHTGVVAQWKGHFSLPQ